MFHSYGDVTSPWPVKGCKFWPMLGTHGHRIERVLYSVPHLLWHGASVYNGHFRRPLTFTTIAERLAVELSLTVLTTRSVAAWIRTPSIPLAGANALTNCARHRLISLKRHKLKTCNCLWNPLVIVNHQIFVDEWKTEIYWSICGPLHRILWPLIWWKILINNK